jgi:hypothetical protein
MKDASETPRDDLPEGVEPVGDECFDANEAHIENQISDRLWIRSIAMLIETVAGSKCDVSPRVKCSIEDMAIAACERAARIFRADLPEFDIDDPDGY